jgi:hypothetical protein
MVFSKRVYKIIIGCILFLSAAGASLGMDDGFGQAEKIRGEFFVVYNLPQIELSSLVRQLNITPTDRLLAGKSIKEGSSTEEGLADALDVLFLWVSDILDMHIYSFSGNIKVCLDQEQVNGIYNDMFGRDLPSFAYSFYVYDTNTIYISAEHFRREVIGHEMSHAIINHYFPIQAPVKVQEILSKYVEYQLRKESGLQ